MLGPRSGRTLLVESQPPTVTRRKAKNIDLQTKILSNAVRLHQQGHISKVAQDYLVSWVTDTMPLKPRPPSYPWLNHRWDGSQNAVQPRQPALYDRVANAQLMRVNLAPLDADVVPDFEVSRMFII